MIFLQYTDILAQGRVYDGPEDGAGDPYLEREGFMVGNRVQMMFKNNTGQTFFHQENYDFKTMI